MKKKGMIPLILSLSLIASCSSIDPDEVLAAAIEAVADLKTPSVTSYSLEVEGHVSTFDQFQEPDDSYSIPSGVPGNTGNSYILRTPIILNAENFYPEDVSDETISTADYSYFKITSRLLWTYDKVTQLQFEMRGDDLVFFVEGLSKNVTMYNILTDETYGIYSSVSMYARYDITLVYNDEGLLIEESIVTENPMSDDMELTVDVTTTYTYF